jgi:multiple sugar transport system ATP-binding protein
VRVGEDRLLARVGFGSVTSDQINSPVYLGYRPERLHFFDEATGQALR